MDGWMGGWMDGLVCMYEYVFISTYGTKISAFADPSKKCLQKAILIRFRAHLWSLVWGGTRTWKPV